MGAIKSFKSLQALVRAIRNARAEYNVEMGKKIGANLRSEDATLLRYLSEEKTSLSLLGRIDEAALSFDALTAPVPSSQCVHLIVEDGLEAYLPLADLVDREKEIARLTKQAEKLTKDIDGLENRLSSKGFADKAPAAVVAEVRSSLAEKKEQRAAILKSVDTLLVSP